jgi:hypothetical protein
MTIQYIDSNSFYDGIYQMVTRGLTFEADATAMTIKLTGGY